jgi:Zn-finger nucleic acid-binding protein
MKCPYCSRVMMVVEHEKIELDYCTNCHGVWFDSGELGLLLDSIGLQEPKQFYQDMVQTPEAKTTEKKRKCPMCNAKMRKTLVGDRPAILLDVCGRGHGLWFDGGELSQLITELAAKAPDSHPQAVHFLGQVFKVV